MSRPPLDIIGRLDDIESKLNQMQQSGIVSKDNLDTYMRQIDSKIYDLKSYVESTKNDLRDRVSSITTDVSDKVSSKINQLQNQIIEVNQKVVNVEKYVSQFESRIKMLELAVKEKTQPRT